MKTQTVGELLASARQKAGYSLTEFATKTRIRAQYLQALENNEFDALPEAVFVKAYIRNYARVLGLELKPLLAILRRDYEESAKGQLIPREFLYPLIKRKQFWSPVRMMVLAVITVFLVVFAYASWQWYQLNRPPELVIQSPTEAAQVAGKITIEGQTNPDAILVINAQPVALRADGSFITDVYFPTEGPATITARVTDKKGKVTTVQRSVVVKF